MATAKNNAATETAKPQPIVASEITGQQLTITVRGFAPMVVNTTTLTQEILDYAALHGLKQKLVDAAAISRNSDTGASATIADKHDAVREVFDRLVGGGTWNKTREGGNGGVSGLSQLARAMMELTGKTRQEIDAYLAPKSDEEKRALKSNERVAAIMAKQAALASNVDSDALLNELMGDVETENDGDGETENDGEE